MNNNLSSWLDHLRILCPPTGVVLVGAGAGTGDWVQRLMQWGTHNVTLVEADETQFEHLQHSVAVRDRWHLRKQVIARNAEIVTYHLASNTLESGLLEPESLRSLWPNLKTCQKQTRQAIALADLPQDAQTPANWLLVDCLPALPIIQGAANQLAAFDVIALRVLLDSQALRSSGATTGELQPALQILGFRCLAIEAGRHPAVGHALFVRDTPAQARQLQQQLTLQAHTHQAETQTLAQAKLDADQLATERQQHTDQLQAQLKQADEHAQAAAAAATTAAAKQAEERAAQVQQLTQAKAAADKLAAERQQEIDKLQNQVKKANEHSQAATQQAEKAQAKEEVTFVNVQQERTDAAKFASEVKSILNSQQTSLDGLTQNIKPLDIASILSTALETQLAKQLAGGKESLNAVETRLRNDLTKVLGNAVKQIEAFLRIQNFLGTGDALGDFHGWPISPDIGLFLLDKMREQHYDLIIEFGSGTSTALFAKAVEVIAQGPVPNRDLSDVHPHQAKTATEIVTFEHDSLYYSKTLKMLKARGLDQRVSLVHAPLVDWRDGDPSYLYYDCETKLTELAQRHSSRNLKILLLVDGPPGTTCANARYPAVPFVFAALGRHKIDVVLDDASRPEEKQVIELWRAFWKKRSIRMIESQVQTEKGTYFATVASK